MGYIFGIVGIVLGGSILCAFLYFIFNSKSNLDDVSANMKEDRRFGNYAIEDYDYDDDERVEIFEDIINYADEVRDMEFEQTVSEINKFIARRSSEAVNETVYVEDEEEGWDEMENVNVNIPIQPQLVEVTTTPQVTASVQSVVSQPVVTQQVVATEPQIIQTQVVQPQVVQQPVVQVEQPVIKPLTTDELYEQINDDFEDEVEEL